MNNNETVKMSVAETNSMEAKTILVKVYEALREKGYNPITQIVGYIMSGDPSYITSHNNARSLIRRMERDELLEELVQAYMVGK
ncbi:MAG: IreB family regulatory phosphoprotein [Clostridiales bacterium]|nr:IreB family regulatory phosphoprotein [Clostridiales bacterium]